MAKKQTTTTEGSQESTPPRKRFARYCLVGLLVCGVVLAWLSVLSFHPTDPPSSAVYPPKRPVDNLAGIAGAYLAWHGRYWLGSGAYAVLGVLTAWAGMLLRGKTVADLPWRMVGMVLLVCAVSGGAFVIEPDVSDSIVRGPGGILGMALGRLAVNQFGPTGSGVMMLAGAVVGLLLSAEELLGGLARLAGRLWNRRDGMAERFAALRRHKLAQTAASAAGAAGNAARAIATAPANALKPDKPDKPAESDPPEPVDKPRPKAPGLIEDRPARPKPSPAPRPKRDDPETGAPAEPSDSSQTADDAPGRPRSEADREATKQRLRAMFGGKPDRPADADADDDAPAPRKPRQASGTLPSIELLEESEGTYDEHAEVQAAQRKLVLQQTLADFNVEAKVQGYMTGPVITLFEVSLAPGVKVSQITNLATDIARSLAVPGVRIVPPRFGKDTVGIEVPNLEKETVRLKNLMQIGRDAEKKMHLPLYLGKDAGGEAIVADLARMPHMLIAGTTGSGKSVCINTIIMSLLMTRTPEEVRFILVDPKMVEMAAFEKLPHLLCPTINEMKKAEDILEWATTKMDERYELLKEAGVKNRDGYNRLSEKELYERFKVETDEEKQRIPKKLPAYVIIIDELADLMMTSSKEVEAYIIRIAQKARAVGIHLVLATQRPSANVVTGLIKSNMPCRVSFQVASGQESRIVLDQKGAEVLLGQGDMLLLQPGTSSLVRAQGTYVDDHEIRDVVKELEATGVQVFDEELVKIQSGSGGEISGEKDEMFDQAVEVVLAAQRGSVSLLQRRLQIGYGRASRIIDQMGEAGILGEHKGSQARECMITLEDWEAMKESIAADQSGQSSLDGTPTSA
jgi:DNA segregation ATPase FtsK/SpoIIIE, S-DNA-T family